MNTASNDVLAARKMTGITIVLLVMLTVVIVSTTKVQSPWLQILACSPVVPALMYFGYAATHRR